MAEKIEGLSIGLSLETMELERGLSGLRDRFRTLNAEMKNQLSVFDRGEKSIDKYGTLIDGMNKKIQTQERIVRSTRQEYEKMVAEHGEGSKEAERARRSHENASATLNNLERAVERTTKEMEEFRKEQERLNSSWHKTGETLEKSGQRMTKIGDGMQDVGKKLTASVTAPLVALGAGSVKSAIDFESAFAGVRKTVDASEVDFAALETGIREMSKELPASANEIAGVAEAAGQLGIETPNILGFTRTMIDLGESTDMSSEQAATALARLANITGMSQEDFDRLGSSVVGLGNNLATTESEIVDMSLRLAGTATQVGLTEAEIMGLAGAMTSMGVNAEAGGSAMSQTMQTINGEVLGAGDNVAKFAEISGMSAEEFAQTWQDEPIVALSAFIGGLGEINESGGDVAGTLDDLGLGGLRQVDVLSRLSNNSDILTDSVDMSNTAWEENTALTEEAEQRYATMESQLEMLKNQLVDVGIDLGEILMPALLDLVESLKEGVSWFSELSDGTKENIVQWGALAAVLGPVLVIGGSFLSSIGNIAIQLGTLSKFIAGKGGLVASFGLLGGKLSSVAAFMTGPWGLAIAAVVGGGIVLHDHMKQDAIPAVEGFGDQVSETTTQAVLDFMDMSNETTTQLSLMFHNSADITQEGSETLTGLFDDMYETIITASEETFNEQYETLSTFFAETGEETTAAEEDILTRMQEGHEERKEEIQGYNDEAAKIIEEAQKQEYGMTDEQYYRLQELNTLAQDEAIVALSDSEQEQLVIKETMSQQKGTIDARTAAETVKRSKEAKEGSIAEANEQYEQVVAAAIFQRDVTGEVTAEEADEIIRQAGVKRDGAVSEAEGMHRDVVSEAKAQAGEHVSEVDWETGEILSKWQVFGQNLTSWFEGFRAHFKELWEGLLEGINQIPIRISNAWSQASGAFTNAMADFFNPAINAVETGINAIINGINWVLDKLGSGSQIGRLTMGRIGRKSSGYNPASGSIPQYEDGADSHPGGPAIVGDGGMRELVMQPDGKMFLSPDTDTLLDLPKGSQVLSGPDTRDYMKGMKIPMYAEGTGLMSRFWDWASGGAKSLLNNAMDFLDISTSIDAPGIIGDIAKGAFSLIKDAAVGFVKGKMTSLSPGSMNFGGMTFMSGWGPRSSPGGIGSTWHRGLDFAAPMGTPIASQTGGTVAQAGYHGIRGNFVRIKQGMYDYMYQHNLRNLVSTGQSVSKGQTIALLGSTGASTGPHLHFEIWRNGTPINPTPFIGNFATGGLVHNGLYHLGEEGYPEWVIPTDPSRRTEAMKLLALAGRQIQGKGNKRPNDLPSPDNVEGVGLNEISYKLDRLIDLLSENNNLDRNTYLDGKEIANGTAQHLDRFQGEATRHSRRGLAY